MRSEKAGGATFPLGRLAATPGALRALEESGQGVGHFLARHASCDWGCLDDEDRRFNDDALRTGDRVLSAYTTQRGVRLYVITEGDRSGTTVLLADEY